MTDLEEAMLRLREAIDILEHPNYLGCCMEAAERIEDALAKLKNVEEPMTERFQLQIDKYNEMITLLQKMQAMIDAPGVCPHNHGQTVGPCIGKGCRDWDDTKGCIWEPPTKVLPPNFETRAEYAPADSDNAEEPEKGRVIIAEEPVEGDDDYCPEEPHIDLTAKLERELHKATEESGEDHKMDGKPPGREGWVKITDRKAANQELFDVSDKFKKQEEEYNRQEWRRNMSMTTSERCSDCEAGDNFGENFCPNCGKRLIKEDE